MIAQSVMEQLPLWGRLVVSGVIFFGFFGMIFAVLLLGLRSTHTDDD